MKNKSESKLKNPDDKLLKRAGLEHEEYAGLKKEFYEKSKVIAGLKRIAKTCVDFCRRTGGKCEVPKKTPVDVSGNQDIQE
jgi:predicted metal-binding transcription factor (methanogenesis marker protein 9)